MGNQLATLGVGGGLSPSQFSGLVLWLKGDVGLFQDAARTTPATANNDPVGGWADQSGAGNHASQSVGGNRPALALADQNGLNTVRFASANWLTSALANTQPYTILLVAKRDVNTATLYLLDGSSTNTGVLNAGSTTQLQLFAGNGVFANETFGQYNQVDGIFNGASSQLAVNGAVTTGNAGASNTAGTTIGAAGGGVSQLNGRIAELIVYNVARSAGELTSLRGYLKSRWNTP